MKTSLDILFLTLRCDKHTHTHTHKWTNCDIDRTMFTNTHQFGKFLFVYSPENIDTLNHEIPHAWFLQNEFVIASVLLLLDTLITNIRYEIISKCQVCWNDVTRPVVARYILRMYLIIHKISSNCVT